MLLRREQESAEKGNPFAKGARKSKVQGRFLVALEMTVWGNGFISCSVQRICLESAIPVTSSRAKPSIFLAHWYNVLCATAGKGNPSAKGTRKRRVQGRFLATFEMTAYWYSVLCETAEKGKPSVKGARKSRAQGGFLDCAPHDGRESS